MALNIPYRLVGGVNFYQRKEIKDMLCYLKTVDNGRDDLAVKRIINVPKRGIGLTSIDKIQQYADFGGISFFDACMEADRIPGLGRALSKINEFVNTIRVTRSLLADGSSLKEIMEYIIKQTGYVKELEAENTDEAKDRIGNIDELVSKLVDYETGVDEPSLSEFLEEVALVADIDSMDSNADYVVLMTIHSAKGLEFPNVYLCGMEEGLFPSYMSINSDDPSDIEEERRLCYVAITRAMNKLNISLAKMRVVRGEQQYNKPSRFLSEIPTELLGEEKKKMPTKASAISGFGRSGGFGSSSGAFGKKSMSASELLSSNAFDKRKTDNTSLEYGVGDTVKHMKFGVGKVLSIDDAGRDFEVLVNFETAGQKRMFASFAKLKKV